MRTFIFISHASTNPKFKDIYKAGRLDIAIHSIIHAFFVSNGLRKYIDFNLLLLGKPDPPKRIQIISNLETPWSKKDIAEMIRIALWKFKEGKKIEALKGVFIERKSLKEILEEYKNKNIYVLDINGKPIEEVKIENPVFVIGDYYGFEQEEIKIAKKYAREIVSLGKIPYFSSQCIFAINYYLDKIGYFSDYWDTSKKMKIIR